MIPLLQDFLIDYFALAHKPLRTRHYLHIGAYDGVHGDSTAYLQQAGWRGVLVEPNPDVVPQLIQNRGDTNTVIFDVACVADDTERQVAYIGYAQFAQHGGLAPHPQKIEPEMRRYGGNVVPKVSVVKAMTVNAILQTAFDGATPKIDYVQIDTEGTEKDVLAGFDLDVYQPTVMCIETDDPRNADMNDYMLALRYKVIGRFGHNTVYERMPNG